jgi:hypothetical protein
MPRAPISFSPLDDVVGDLRLALDLERVDVLLEERPQLDQKRLALLDRRRVELGLRMNQVKPEIA